MTAHRIGVLLAAAGLVVCIPTLAQSLQPEPVFTLAQTDPAANTQIKVEQVNPVNIPTSGTVSNIPPVAPKDKVEAPPITSTTRVEVHNEAPAVNPPVNPPANINITMPESKVEIPAENNTQKEIVTEHTTVIRDDKSNEPRQDNFLYLAIFGMLALVVIVGMILAFARRRRVGIPL